MNQHQSIQSIEDCLDDIIVRRDCVLSYDRNLIDLLPDILAENLNITVDEDISRLSALTRLFELLDAQSGKDRHIHADLIDHDDTARPQHPNQLANQLSNVI